MNVRWFGGQTGRILAVLVLAGALIGFGPGLASASTCTGWTGTPPVNPSSTGDSLAAVSVVSQCNVWAVGYYQMGPTKTLAEHWDGTGWAAAPSSSPGGTDDQFSAVAAKSSAVGNYFDIDSANQTLIVHWDGKKWKRVPSPDPAGPELFNNLFAVAASSASNAWAVGGFAVKGSGTEPLIEHWNGKTWKQVKSPSLDNGSVLGSLRGVTVVSASDAWAVGYATNSSRTVIARWNGKTWSRVPSPDPGTSFSQLFGVAASSATDVWAVGTYSSNAPAVTFAVHCC